MCYIIIIVECDRIFSTGKHDNFHWGLVGVSTEGKDFCSPADATDYDQIDNWRKLGRTAQLEQVNRKKEN